MSSNLDKVIAEVAGQAGITRGQATAAVRATFDAIGEALLEGETVAVPKFGSFVPFQASQRTARNPQTGAKIMVSARIRPKFKASSVLEKKVNPGA